MTQIRTVGLVLVLFGALFLAVVFMGGRNGEDPSPPPPAWTSSVRNAFGSMMPSVELHEDSIQLAPGRSWNRIIPPSKSSIRILRIRLESSSELTAVYMPNVRNEADQRFLEMMEETGEYKKGRFKLKLPRPSKDLNDVDDDPLVGSFVVISGGGRLDLTCTGPNPCRVLFE